MLLLLLLFKYLSLRTRRFPSSYWAKVRAGRSKKERHSYFVLLSSQLFRQTRAETLATLARNTWAEKL